MKKLGFIGAGNMGGALLDACAKKISGEEIIVTDPDAARVTHFSEKYGHRYANDIYYNNAMKIFGKKESEEAKHE